jgi:hypothetical protein
LAAAPAFAQNGPPPGERLQPAPAGDPVEVATSVLSQAKNSCGTVKRAKRHKDGLIDARCANGARFVIFTFKGEVMAKRCTGSGALGVHGC